VRSFVPAGLAFQLVYDDIAAGGTNASPSFSDLYRGFDPTWESGAASTYCVHDIRQVHGAVQLQSFN
jgi:hypothetical protein